MKRLIVVLTGLLVLSLTGCGPEDRNIYVYKGEGERWEVEFKISKDDHNNYYLLRSKNALHITESKSITSGFLWLHKEAEIVSNGDTKEVLSNLMLSQNHDNIREIINLSIDAAEPKRAYVVNINKDVVWNGSRQNEEEFKYYFRIPELELDIMASELLFVVKWGDDKEIINVVRGE